MNTDLVSLVKAAVLRIEPSAKVILYGSRARNDVRPDSDWDFLILTSRPATTKLKETIRRQLYEIEWDTGQVITTVIHHQDEWDTTPLRCTPFHDNVCREGMPV